MTASVARADSRRASARREEILDVAGEVFAERGIANATVRDIAAAAGILSGSLYHHFESKDHMVLELLEGHGAELTALMEGAVQELAPLDALRAGLRAAVRFAAQHPSTCRILRNETSYIRTTPALAVAEARRQQHREMWVDLVRRCIADGRIRADVQPDLVVRAMWDGALGSTRWFPPWGAERPDDVADQLVALYLDGLLAG